LALFRQKVLPLIHNCDTVNFLIKDKTEAQRQDFYSQQWNSWRWRLLFRIFFSQFILGRLGRDPSFFDYVQDDVAEHLLQRTRYVITTLSPAENPYFQWIATEQHLTALPYALRPENFEKIRSHLDRLEWHCTALENYLQNVSGDTFNCYNLSNIFEYVSSDNYHYLLKQLVRVGKNGARLAYWNLLVKRNRPEDMKNLLHSLGDTAKRLYQEDKAFFYSAFVVEEIIHCGKTSCCQKS
jgi:S-adenosylmethionine-diacylglycerol 3-amino-3-carboxypropyl transferase